MKSTETCLTCQNYNKCTHPDKTFGFRCVSYSKVSGTNTSLLLDMLAEDSLSPNNPPQPKIIHTISEEDATKKEGELIDYMNDVINNPNPIPKDLKFDDGDLKEFPNFYDWCMSSHGANTPPFARQLAIGLHLFGEYCPNSKCTSPRFGNIYTVPYKASPELIADNVSILRNGICPKCGARRSELFKNGHLNMYDEFAGALGQRSGKCLVAGSLLLTDSGLIPIEELLSNNETLGFTKYTGSVKVSLPNGTLAPISHNYVESKRNTYRATIKSGIEIEGTRNHPMMTQRSWVTLSHLTTEDCFPVTYGQKVFGSTLIDMSEANRVSREYIDNQTSKTIKAKMGSLPKDSRRMTKRLAQTLGFWVAEGRGGRVEVCNYDQDVLDLVHKELVSLYGSDSIYRTDNLVGCRNYYAREHFNVLLGGGVMEKSATKFVPASILTAPKGIQSAFLQALYEGDGGVETGSVMYTSLSEKLIRTVSTMLHNFGIPCTIKTSRTWATNGSPKQISKKCWKIEIRGFLALKAFAKEIGFFSDRKVDSLAVELAYYSTAKTLDMPFWYDKFPQCIKDEFIQILDTAQILVSRLTRNKTNTGLLKGSVGNNIGNNTDYGRIYSDNVALSKRRVSSTFKILRSMGCWSKVRKDLDPILKAFESKYLAPNTYWSQVVDVSKSEEKKKTYDITVPEHHMFIANGLTSHNSAMFSLFAPYVIHKYLKMQNPNRLFGLMENTILAGTFVGLTFARAMSLLWTPVLNIMTSSSQWFIDYHAMMADYSSRYGIQACVVKDTFIDYRHRRIRLYPSGPNKRTLRGDTRIISGIDEAGWFHSGDDGDEERERASGKEVHGALDRSLKTARMAIKKLVKKGYDNIPGAYNISISSPSHTTDLIMYLTGLYENSSECLALRIPTWEFNPSYESRDDFKKEYAENYARAERDFGVNPLVSENRAYSQTEVVTIGQKFQGENLLDVRTTAYTSSTDNAYTKPIIQRMTPSDVPTVISMDAGEVNNSFALTLIQRRDASVMPRVAGVIELMPIKGTRINFNDVYTELLEELFRVYNICGVVTDRWQSIAILNRIESEHGIYTKQLTARPAHFTTFDSYHRPEMLVSYPKSEMPLSEVMAPSSDDYRTRYYGKPVAHLLHQFDTVQDLGGIFDKGAGNTDDLLRAAVLGINVITDPSFVDKYLKQKVRTVSHSVGAVGSMGGMLSGYGSHQATNVGASSVGASSSGGVAQVDIGHLGASSLGIRR